MKIILPARLLEARLEVLFDLKEYEKQSKIRDQINDDIIAMQIEYFDLTGRYYIKEPRVYQAQNDSSHHP